MISRCGMLAVGYPRSGKASINLTNNKLLGRFYALESALLTPIMRLEKSMSRGAYGKLLIITLFKTQSRREIGVFTVERSDARSFGTASWSAPGKERVGKSLR